MRPKALFVGATYIKANTIIGEVDDKTLKQTIEAVQEEKMLPVLGEDLYEHLVNAVHEETTTNDEETLIEDYIQTVMKWYVLAELPISSSIKFTGKGLKQRTGDNENTMDMSEIFSVMKYYKNKAEYQEQRLICYLKDNTDLFPKYLDSDTKDHGYSCPIVL
jgi:hypothetical protein